MKLWLVLGGAEYLLRGLSPQLMLPILRSFDPQAHLPAARWLTGAADAPLYQELFKGNAEEVITLFLQSLQESYGADDNVYVPLCFESSVQLGSGPIRIRDSRSALFFDLAARTLGSSTLRCLRFYLSARTDAVLDVLEARMAAAKLDARHQPASRSIEAPLVSVELESRELPEAVQAALWANYQDSVLRRLGALLAVRLPFDPASFGKAFARRTQAAGVSLRRDLQPADVLSSLESDQLLAAVALL